MIAKDSPQDETAVGTQHFSSQIRERLATVERRDWELWALALGSLAIVTVGLCMILLPAALSVDRTFQFGAAMSPSFLLSVVLLVGATLVYLIHKQIQLRAMRVRSINETWQYETFHVKMLMDPLTQVFNRAALRELMQKEITRAQRSKNTIVLLYIDVDDFKKVNTNHGHLFGDLVLAEVGGLLKSSIRGSDFIVRMGGDEFLVALSDTNEVGGHIVKRRIIDRVADWNKTSPIASYQLSLSCGLQELRPDDSFEEALALVDEKMYDEKNTVGRR